MPISDEQTAAEALLAIAGSSLSFALLHPYAEDDGTVVGSDLDLVVDREPAAAACLVVDSLRELDLHLVHTATESGDPMGLTFLSVDARRFVQIDLHHRPRPNINRMNYAALLESAGAQGQIPVVPQNAVLIYQAMKSFHKGDAERLKCRLLGIRLQMDAGEEPTVEVLTGTGRALLRRLMTGEPTLGARVGATASRYVSRIFTRFTGPRANPVVVSTSRLEEEAITYVESSLRRGIAILATARIRRLSNMRDCLPVPFGRLPIGPWLRWRRGWPLVIWDSCPAAGASDALKKQPFPKHTAPSGRSMQCEFLERTILAMSDGQSGFLRHLGECK